MNTTPLWIAAVVILPAVGLVVWAWAAMAQVEDDLRSFSGLEGMHFDA
jgi:hypothetical protein